MLNESFVCAQSPPPWVGTGHGGPDMIVSSPELSQHLVEVHMNTRSTHIHLRKYVQMRPNSYVHAYTNIFIYIYIYTNICIYAYIHV